jgi:hypothetical protein
MQTPRSRRNPQGRVVSRRIAVSLVVSDAILCIDSSSLLALRRDSTRRGSAVIGIGS